MYVIIAHRTGGVLGPATALAKDVGGIVMQFATKEDAEAKAKDWNDRTSSPNVHYSVALKAQVLP